VGSTNGTFLNGVRLTRARKLSPGDVVRIGETELRYDK
jgi:pSer/pThr/pTyr-binding forkhead associated (FHA) protein